MKPLLILLLCLYTAPAEAQRQFTFPKLAKQAKDISSLIPPQWHAIDTAYGDLNGDKAEDMVLVLEYDHEIREQRAYGDNITEIIAEQQRPRILAAYFGIRDRQAFTLALQNNDFVLRANEGGKIGDPYRSVAIEAGALSLSFAGGNNWRWDLKYGFRYKGTAWVLTEAFSRYFHQDTGEMTSRTFDFILQEVDVVSGNIHNRAAGNHEFRESLRDEPLRTFKTFKKPWAWEILPDTYL
ncbi:hypothetical protein [Pedobacter sp. SYP-B3415]|uniref:hypothetical protein n=1 Tax=Pedobacter sp. SYP-B3415 TaxID=2496641 RepID=UPI00101E0CBD|nr:hypothetical protein [Pedobacter sp. SYP-B3415]